MSDNLRSEDMSALKHLEQTPDSYMSYIKSTSDLWREAQKTPSGESHENSVIFICKLKCIYNNPEIISHYEIALQLWMEADYCQCNNYT